MNTSKDTTPKKENPQSLYIHLCMKQEKTNTSPGFQRKGERKKGVGIKSDEMKITSPKQTGKKMKMTFKLYMASPRKLSY